MAKGKAHGRIMQTFLGCNAQKEQNPKKLLDLFRIRRTSMQSNFKGMKLLKHAVRLWMIRSVLINGKAKRRSKMRRKGGSKLMLPSVVMSKGTPKQETQPSMKTHAHSSDEIPERRNSLNQQAGW